MRLLKGLPKSYLQFYLGQLVFSWSTVIMALVISMHLGNMPGISSSTFAVIGVATMLPRACSFLFSPWLDRLANYKKSLLTMVVVSMLLDSLANLLVLGHFDLVLYTLVLLSGGVCEVYLKASQGPILPLLVNQDSQKIEQAVDLSYLLNTLSTIGLGLVLSLVINASTESYLLWSAIGLEAIAYLLFWRLPKLEQSPIESGQIASSYVKGLGDSFKTFIGSPFVLSIILIEALLAGLTTVVVDTLPLGLKMMGLSVAYLGITKSLQKLGDFAGGLLAPFIKLETRQFFILDYLVSGACFIAIVCVDQLMIKAGLFLLAFVVIGVSGNVFNKLVYQSWQVEDLSGVGAWISTCFAGFSLISFVLPMVVKQVLIYWVVMGALTILSGIGLLIYSYWQRKIN